MLESSAERTLLFSPWAKPWTVHRGATLRSAEHPGTAVRWEDALYEVVDARREPSGGFLYTLAPWDERHAIRLVLDYSAATEAARVAEVADYRRREGLRWVAVLLAPLTGLLPTAHQEHFERELGLRATVLTALSLILPGLYGSASVIVLMAAGFSPLLRQGVIPVPLGPLLLGGYLFAETGLRLAVWASGRPIGSLLGLPLAWGLRLVRRVAGLPPIEPPSPPREAASAGRQLEDRYRMLEALAGLLPAADQLLLKDRFGFDPVLWGRRTAVFLLVYPGLTLPAQLSAFTERPLGLPGLLALALTAVVTGEQVARLLRLRSGRPAPSLLGHLVRPLAAPLLFASPPYTPGS